MRLALCKSRMNTAHAINSCMCLKSSMPAKVLQLCQIAMLQSRDPAQHLMATAPSPTATALSPTATTPGPTATALSPTAIALRHTATALSPTATALSHMATPLRLAARRLCMPMGPCLLSRARAQAARAQCHSSLQVCTFLAWLNSIYKQAFVHLIVCSHPCNEGADIACTCKRTLGAEPGLRSYITIPCACIASAPASEPISAPSGAPAPPYQPSPLVLSPASAPKLVSGEVPHLPDSYLQACDPMLSNNLQLTFRHVFRVIALRLSEQT